MKSNKVLPAIAALMMLATVQASAGGQTYDPCDNYYSVYYGIDMTTDDVVTHDSDATTTAALQKQQQFTAIDVGSFSDPTNFYSW